MRRRTILLGAACSVTLLCSVAGAKSLSQRHHISLALAAWNQATDARTESGIGSVSTSVEAGGVGVGLVYGYGLSEAWALQIQANRLAAEVNVQTGVLSSSVDAATVTQLLLGAKAYFPGSTYGSSVRPFALAAVGPFVGSQTGTDVSPGVTMEARTETAMGGQLGAGVDFVIGRHFLTGLSIGYNLMTDFDQSVGGSKNYSGPTATINLGYIFGSGAD